MRRKWRGLTALGAFAVAAAANTALAATVPFVADGNKDIGVPGDPAAPGSYSVVGDVHSVTGGGADWWDTAERAHIAYTLLPAGEWRMETQIAPLPRWVEGADPAVEYDFWVKAGLFIRNDVDFGGAAEGREVNALMAALRGDRNASSLQWRLANNTNTMSNADRGGPNPPAALALQRRILGGVVTMVDGFVSFDGSSWEYVGSTAMPNLVAQPYGGLAVTAHRNTGVGNLLTAEFTNPTISTEVVAPPVIPMRAVTGPVPDPGMTGMWAIREVHANPNQTGVGNLSNTVNSLNNPAGNVVDYLRPWVNISDPFNGGGGRVTSWPSNERYQVQVEGLVAGEVNNISMVMSSKIVVPESGWYTFDVASDDGFELAVNGTVVMQANFGKGDSSVLGYVELPAGVHDLRVLYWEGGGGAGVEVRSAPGVQTNPNDSAFGLVGHPGFNIDYKVPGMANVQTTTTKAFMPEGQRPSSRDTALYWLEQGEQKITTEVDEFGNEYEVIIPATNFYGTANRVNHGDPDQGGGGSYRQAFNADNRLPFPNNVGGVDENDFAFMAVGKLIIPTTGTWYIGYESDDGAALQIVGQTWGTILENATGLGVVEGDWLKTDAWTGNSRTIASINLEAGEYDFKFVMYEGGGGAFATVFGSNVQGLYDVIMGDPRDLNFMRSAGLQLAVPEPGSMMLMALGALGLMARRRRA